MLPGGSCGARRTQESDLEGRISLDHTSQVHLPASPASVSQTRSRRRRTAYGHMAQDGHDVKFGARNRFLLCDTRYGQGLMGNPSGGRSALRSSLRLRGPIFMILSWTVGQHRRWSLFCSVCVGKVGLVDLERLVKITSSEEDGRLIGRYVTRLTEAPHPSRKSGFTEKSKMYAHRLEMKNATSLV